MKFLEWLAFLFPRPLALRLSCYLGGAAYYIFKKRRRLALYNLKLALGENYTDAQRKKIIYRLYQHLAMSLTEFLRSAEITQTNLSEFMTFQGRDILEKAYQEANQKGILVLTAHIGNWEFLSSGVSLAGYNTAVIVKTARQKSVNNYIYNQRKFKNIKSFSGKKVLKNIFKQLRAGGLVGIVLDQHGTANESVRVPFFGRNANTFKSLAVLSQRTSAIILPLYTYRDENNHHHIIIEKPIEHAPGESISTRTLKYNQWLESVIRRHPEQWIWTHNRWK